MSVIYEGFFIRAPLESTLSKDIEFKHVTTQFRPPICHQNLYGKTARFVITGYGNDGDNEGVSVSLATTEEAELVELFNSIAIPHITLSVSEKGKPVNTVKLEFDNNSSELIGSVVEGTFGGFNGKNPIFEGE